MCSNLAGTFTLAFSWYAGLETVTNGKIFGIAACFIGAVCIGLNDERSHGSSHPQTVIGDVVALFAALGYGLYTTVIRYQVGTLTTITSTSLKHACNLHNFTLMLMLMIMLLLFR